MNQKKNRATAGKVFAALSALGWAGVVAWGVRWFLQGEFGERTVWTDTALSFWTTEPVLGWQATEARWVWLGLDGLGVVVGTLVGSWGAWWVATRTQARWGQLMKGAAWLGAAVAAVAVAVPVWAWTSGWPPAGARRLLPEVTVAEAIEGDALSSLPVAAKRWRVAESKATLVVAQIAAGGDKFDARWSGLNGSLELSPENIKDIQGELNVDAASVVTGVGLRDSHTRADLKVEAHPRIAMVLDGLAAVTGGGAEREVRGEAVLKLMGREITVPVRGSAVVLDEVQRGKLEVVAQEAILVNAEVDVAVAATELDRSSFDSDMLRVTVRVVLVPDGPGSGGVPHQ